MPTYKTGPEGAERKECECGNPYWVTPDTRWKTSCYECWKLRKERSERLFRERYQDAKEGKKRPRDEDPSLTREFHENLRAMIQLCHPDRHNGSDVAKRITQWLLSYKR